jgi:hypothetical protein
MMAETWHVKSGSLWRTFKIQRSRSGPFVKSGTLTAVDGRLELATKYDPPGSGWLAAAAAIVTGILVMIAAQQFGFCAGPGWLFWFIGIAMLRRRSTTLNVGEADAAVIDPANRRLAFHVNFEGKPRWVALDVSENFDAAAQAVATQLPGRVVQDNIPRGLTSGSIAMIVLASLLGVLIVLSVLSVFIFMLRRPPVRTVSMTTIHGWGPIALSFAPEFFRRTRYTAE